MADLAAVDAMVAKTVETFGRLNIAVANAAYSDREPFYKADLAGFRRTIDVVMWGMFNLLHSAANRMIAAEQGGSIVIVSSPHAYIPIPLSMAYNMSKGAVNQMARTAAHGADRASHSSEHRDPRLDRHPRRAEICLGGGD